MPYIGNQPGTGVRSRFIYTATASQTTFSGADDNSKTLKYADSDYIDVYLNGVCLVPGTDYTASTKTSVVLTQAASVSDTLEVVAYDIATISDTVSKADGGTFEGDLGITNASPDITITNNTTEDTDGGRESTVTFKGLQSGGEESTLAQIQASHDATADDEKGDLIFKTNDGSDGASPTEAMRIASDQKVGIGTATGSGKLTVQDSSLPKIQANFNDAAHLEFGVGGSGCGFVMTDGHFMTFNHQPYANAGSDTNLTERMRIDSSGNFLVGTTDANPGNNSGGSDVGSVLDVNGKILGTANGAEVMVLNRQSSNGTIAEFRQDGTQVASIITYGASSEFSIGGTGTNTVGLYFSSANELLPMKANSLIDASQDFGKANFRWAQIFASNGSINTSDETEKQNIASLTSAEITAATAISKLFKTYKWKDAVTAKGDDARTHTGVIAQQIQTAMSDAGLDASKYGFWCSDTWWETQTDVPAVEADEENGIEAADAYTRTDTYDTLDEAPEGATEHTRMGIRYAELLSFIGAATEQRLTSIESRLTALEAE